jgi:ATP-binding cassette subfamily C protein
MGFLEVVGIASILPFMQLLAEPNAIEKSSLLKGAYDFFAFESHRSMLIATGVGVIVLITLTNIFSAITIWLQFKYSWQVAHNMATRLLRTYLRKPYSFYLNKNTSELRAYLVSEVGKLTSGVLIPFIEMTSRAVVSFVIFGLLIWVDPKVAFTMAGVLGGAYLLIFFSQRKILKRLGEVRIKTNVARYKTLAELLTGIKTVKVSGTKNFFYGRYEAASEEFCSVQPKVSVMMAIPKYFLEVFAFGGILAVTLYLYTVGGNLQAALPRLSLYAVAGYRLLPALQRAFTAASRLKHNMPVLEKLHPDLYASLHDNFVEETNIEALPFHRDFILKNVSFHYENMPQLVLNNLNVTIQKGEIVAFVGSTGAGKTTLIDLLVGLLNPTDGQLLVDGKALTTNNHAVWQQQISYVPQEVFLFDDTVARNVAIGETDEQIDWEQLKKVTQLADIYSFIQDEMPEKFHTQIGERGVRLSGGQRQRLGLARALYRNPSVLVLDEATSALDSITEKSIIESLKTLPDNMTIVIIAHRLSTVRHADCIYLLENGQIVDQGSYDRLQESSGVFREMVHLS